MTDKNDSYRSDSAKTYR